ncbi:MAG: hypothetical protein AAF288_10325 [Planctomycetota bacterium]
MRDRPAALRWLRLLCWICPAVLGVAVPAEAEPPRVFLAEQYGVVGDGETDDGPAIQRLVAEAQAHQGPTEVRFQPDRVYYADTGHARYLFHLEDVQGLSLDGGGSVFLLSPNLRFMHAERCGGLRVRNLIVDFAPLPFVDAGIVAADAEERWIEVRLPRNLPEAQRPGPATREDREQLFFGIVWNPGDYGVRTSMHYVVGEVTPPAHPRAAWRIGLAEGHGIDFGRIHPGRSQISLPVPGVAHRYGPGHCVRIQYSADVVFEDVEVWSAPWFAFGVFENLGPVSFYRTHVRPKPGSGRLTSAWRDAFHAKQNRGPLLWDGSILTGMNDDAFNIAYHTAIFVQPESPRRFGVRQDFPLQIASLLPGDELVLFHPSTGELSETLRVLEVEGETETVFRDGEPTAPVVMVEVDTDTPEWAVGSETRLWNRTASNPDTTIRNCHVEQSCRMRSPMTIEDSVFRSLVWFHAEQVETPIPHDLVIRRNEFTRGRGNPSTAVAFNAYIALHQPDGTRPASRNITFENNRVRGDMVVRNVETFRLTHNRFEEADAAIQFRNVRDVTFSHNRGPQGVIDPTALPNEHGTRWRKVDSKTWKSAD